MELDDQTPLNWWKYDLKSVEAKLQRMPAPNYSPLPDKWLGAANSNSWCYKLLKETNLLDEYARATDKRGGTPMIPGWGLDPWGPLPNE